MKRIFVLLLALFAYSAIKAQTDWDVTTDARVDKQDHSSYGDANILSVAINDEATIVVWEYISSRNMTDGWISLASTTKIVSSQLYYSLKISEWGIINDDDYSPLELDKQYTVQSDRRYVLYMQFPSLPINVNVFDINEVVSGGDGFVWKGIHINPRTNNRGSSSSMSKSGYGNGRDVNTNSMSKSPNTSSSTSPERGTLSGSFEATGSGTGFAVAKGGYVATCYHVVKDARKIRIRGVNGDFESLLKAEVVNVDRDNDLALLKITDSRFSSFENIPYTISNNHLDVGESVFVLGFPLRAIMGDEIKLTNGIISSGTGYQGDESSYQLTATVQPGNSGGPLFDKNGNVRGVVGSRLVVESATYAVKSDYLRSLIMSKELLMPMGNGELEDMSLPEQVRAIKPFVYIIEIEE